jgi:hypothetical protein
MPYNDISALPVADEKLEDERLRDPAFHYTLIEIVQFSNNLQMIFTDRNCWAKHLLRMAQELVE